MGRKSLRVIALLICILMCIFILVSCGDKGQGSKESISKSESDSVKKDDTADSEKDEASDSQNGEWPEPNEMPIVDEKIKLTMFTVFPAGHAEAWETLNDSPNMKALEEITNIEVDIQAIPDANYAEKKNLLFASGELPDIIFSKTCSNDALMYGVSDNLVLPLDDLIEKHAYNFNQWLDYEPAIREQSISADGKMYYMPYVDIGLANLPGAGYYIRESWLKELNIEPPQTFEELYEVLKLFKEKDLAGGGNTIPLAGGGGADFNLTGPLFGSYGTGIDIYRIDDEVKYGPVEPEFKEVLEYLNKLYKEGLIASDYLTHDKKIYDANLPENIGITYGSTNGHVRVPLIAAGFDAMEAVNTFRPIAAMKGPDGNNYWFPRTVGKVTNNLGEFISSSNKYPVETIKWLDYKYSKEGAHTMCYGPKGKAWDFDDQGARYATDFVVNNPDGLTPEEALLESGQMIWAYTGGIANLGIVTPTSRWPYTYDDIDYLRNMWEPEPESIYTKHFQNWMDFDSSRQMPPNISYTIEEQEEIGVLSQDITTYVEENMHRFIMGLEPMDKWDDVVKQLKGMNVDRLIEIHQGALDRVK